MRPLLIALVLSFTALPALAQDRTPAVRQNLVDLAYVLGEAHALRQACEGTGDQYWRTRMIRMVDAEQPDTSLDRRMREAFNTGFASRQGQYEDCSAATRRAEAAILARGRDLAGRLAQVTVAPVETEAQPDIMADRPGAR